ncbi:endonuclease/exonuclease/phosphatase family protein [Haliangium sp.]|uniref:endonuclease/exonuclease/phosphatase family protein n=1 Tax=Haliangium sp. TaxID=2663208 RepID=UPI003D0BD28B
MPSTLKVITFNIGMGYLNVKLERSWRRNPVLRKAGRVMPSLDRTWQSRGWLRRVDILGLQEVCHADSGQIPYFEKVFRPEGIAVHHHAGQESPDARDDCRKGQATLSRFAIRNSGVLQLPRVGSDRATIWADIPIAGMKAARGSLLRVYNVHLSNREGKNWRPLDGRVRQIQVVLDHARQLEAEAPGAPVVILGDFNSLGDLLRPADEEPAIELVKREFSSALTRFTQTFMLPYMTDWIFYRHLRLESAGVARIFFSDHFPVVASFNLDP